MLDGTSVAGQGHYSTKMAEEGGKSLKSQAEIDKEAIRRYNRLLQESLNREKKLTRHWQWRGNKLPPFNIEPFAYERHRLGNGGMSAEDRALRKQWVKDQILSPNEPRHIPELQPRNPIRRAIALPWDTVFKALKPVLVSDFTVQYTIHVQCTAVLLSHSQLFALHSVR